MNKETGLDMTNTYQRKGNKMGDEELANKFHNFIMNQDLTSCLDDDENNNDNIDVSDTLEFSNSVDSNMEHFYDFEITTVPMGPAQTNTFTPLQYNGQGITFEFDHEIMEEKIKKWDNHCKEVEKEEKLREEYPELNEAWEQYQLILGCLVDHPLDDSLKKLAENKGYNS